MISGSRSPLAASRRILIIRTDNIGDLVCTTPLIRTLRGHFPDSWIGMLANAYSAPVLTGNPDIDELFIYEKAKHNPDDPALRIYWRRARLILKLRRLRLDDIIIAATEGTHSALRFAKLSAAKNIIGPDLPIAGAHEVERVYSRLAHYGIQPGYHEIPPCRVVADSGASNAFKQRLPATFAGRSLIGLHISARKTSQRLSATRFSELAHQLHRQTGCAFLLFWSPGAENHPQHPGDDDKAAQILAQCADLPILGVETQTLRTLIDALNCCERVICADGGTMHIAAGLGKPLVCLFGSSDAVRWHPWGVPYRLLQPESHRVEDIPLTDILTACNELAEESKTPSG